MLESHTRCSPVNDSGLNSLYPTMDIGCSGFKPSKYNTMEKKIIVTLNRLILTLGLGADGQLSVGKDVWLFHSKIKEGIQKETVDVLCYINGRYDHLEVRRLAIYR